MGEPTIPGSRVNFDFSGARVLVTGGTRGIGRAISQAFAAAGAEVLITGSAADASAYADLPPTTRYLQLRLAERADIRSLVSSIGHLDVLGPQGGGGDAAGLIPAPACFLDEDLVGFFIENLQQRFIRFDFMHTPRHHVHIKMPSGPSQQEGFAEVIQKHTAFDDRHTPAAILAQILNGYGAGTRRELTRSGTLHERIQTKENAFQHAGQHHVARRNALQLGSDFVVYARQADHHTALHRKRLAGYVQATIYSDARAAIAYVLGSRYWGQGLARRAVRAMIRELAAHHGVRCFSAVLKRNNFRSSELLERLGFALATAARCLEIDTATDELAYVLERAEDLLE